MDFRVALVADKTKRASFLCLVMVVWGVVQVAVFFADYFVQLFNLLITLIANYISAILRQKEPFRVA